MAFHRRFLLACLLLAPLAAGCTARGGPAAPEPIDDRPMPADPDERLRWALADTRAPERLDALAALEDSLRDLDLRLADIVEDTGAHAVVRANAVLLLGERQAVDELLAFWTALESPDARLRAAAAGALRGILAANQTRGLRLMRRALRDPEPVVQARALEAIGDVDVDVLREYLASGPRQDLARVATDLIRIAEERGAPLAVAAEPAAAQTGSGDAMPAGGGGTMAKGAGAEEASLVLFRTAASGARVEFRARKHWPQWEVAVGELIVTPAGGTPIHVSSEVEVVGRVVPAFFSVDGRNLVYEAAREIRVLDLAGGGERTLGPGIAPRVIPFSPWFVFLRELPERREERKEATGVRYEVLRASFDGGEPERLGELRATLRMDQHGYASPARWMRVRERDGVFNLEGEGIGIFDLPDPFTAVLDDT